MEMPINELAVRAAVIRYQETRAPQDAGIALELADPLIRGMLSRAATVRALDFDEAYSRLRIKVWKALRSYKPESGRVFSYLNATVQNCVRTLCSEQARMETPLPLDEELPTAQDSREAMEELQHRLYQVRTICQKTNELAAQRWLVRSLLQSEFSLPRHQAVRALQIVFAVDLRQGRLIHDRTLLELRRTLLERERFPLVRLTLLRDRRVKGLLKYRPYLCEQDFCKLAYLLRGLAPAIIEDLIAREMRALNGDGTPARKREIVREILQHTLNGFPQAKPLFEVIS